MSIKRRNSVPLSVGMIIAILAAIYGLSLAQTRVGAQQPLPRYPFGYSFWRSGTMPPDLLNHGFGPIESYLYLVPFSDNVGRLTIRYSDDQVLICNSIIGNSGSCYLPDLGPGDNLDLVCTGGPCHIDSFVWDGRTYPPPPPTRTPYVPTPRPFMKSRPLTPASLTTQSGTTNGSLSSLSLIDQTGAEDNPAAYISFQTPGSSSYSGYKSFFLPEDARSDLISTMLLQVNFKGPSSTMQTWMWSVYDWNNNLWIEVGDTLGVSTSQWKMLVFRINQAARYISPGREIRIQLKSNNVNGDARIDYEAIHVTYLSIPTTPTPVAPTPPPGRPGIASAPNATPAP